MTRLTRLPRAVDGESRYLHPGGFIIESARRDWSERTGRIAGQADPPPPLKWWNVHRRHSRVRLDVQPVGRPLTTEATLRDAREWCDEQVAVRGEEHPPAGEAS